jgi:hypothetical protein
VGREESGGATTRSKSKGDGFKKGGLEAKVGILSDWESG